MSKYFKMFSFLCVFLGNIAFANGYTYYDPITKQNREVPDYTMVGYHKGNRPLPSNKPATINYPAGTFTITDKIVLQKGQILRGAGKGKTILYFPNSLNSMGHDCKVESSDAGDCWDWDGGVIELLGKESGVENLTIRFPDHVYEHHNGQGYNGVLFNNTKNSWVKNVSVENADVGFHIRGGKNNTIKDVEVYGGYHFYIGMTATSKNLVINFKIFYDDIHGGIHGLTGNWGGSKNVFANGVALDRVMFTPSHAHASQPQTSDFLYSNISGNIVYSGGNGGNFGGAIFWNTGRTNLNPLDVYVDMMIKKKGIDPRGL